MSNKMIHEAMNSAAVSAGRAAVVQEYENRWVKQQQVKCDTARQQDLVSCHSREVGIADADLVLRAAREPAATRKRTEAEVFMLKDFSHHVN